MGFCKLKMAERSGSLGVPNGAHVRRAAFELKIAECREKVTGCQLCLLFPDGQCSGWGNPAPGPSLHSLLPSTRPKSPRYLSLLNCSQGWGVQRAPTGRTGPDHRQAQITQQLYFSGGESEAPRSGPLSICVQFLVSTFRSTQVRLGQCVRDAASLLSYGTYARASAHLPAVGTCSNLGSGGGEPP